MRSSSLIRLLSMSRLQLLAMGLILLAVILGVDLARAAGNHPRVLLQTSMGDIEVELLEDKAPKTVANFLAYVKEGHYNGTIFHRVIGGFMIQGGGFTADMVEKPTKSPVESEADNGLKNEIYSLAMARTPDPHSATAQFFINVKNNDFLNHTSKTPRGWGYTVFGEVSKGQGVVNKIEAVATATKGRHENVPVQPVTIIKAEVVRP